MAFQIVETLPHTKIEAFDAVATVVDMYRNQSATPPPPDPPLPPPSTGLTYSMTRVGAIIPRPAGWTNKGPFFPTMLDMRSVAAFPGDIGCWFSTDHDTGPGGIWLAICTGDPAVPANWVLHSEAPVYNYPLGSQHETPNAQLIGGTVFLTGHSNDLGFNQSTWIATSTDGIGFTSGTVIIDYDPATAPGDGHSGYFSWAGNPFAEHPFAYIGASLHGGGTTAVVSALWGVDDPLGQWTKIGLKSVDQGRSIAGSSIPNPTIAWHGASFDSVIPLGEGRYSILGNISEAGFGSVPRKGAIAEIIIDSDLNILSRPVEIMPPTLVGADADGCAVPAVLDYDGMRLVACTGHNGNVNAIVLYTSPIPDTELAHVLLSPAVPSSAPIVEDFTGGSLPPGWVVNGAGLASFNLFAGCAMFVAPVADSFAQIRTGPIFPDLYDFIEWRVWGYRQNNTTSQIAPMCAMNIDPDFVQSDRQIRGLTWLGQPNGLARFHVENNGSVVHGGSSAFNEPFEFPLMGAGMIPVECGLRFWPQDRQCVMLGHGFKEVSDIVHLPASWDISTPIYCAMGGLAQDASGPTLLLDRAQLTLG